MSENNDFSDLKNRIGEANKFLMKLIWPSDSEESPLGAQIRKSRESYNDFVTSNPLPNWNPAQHIKPIQSSLNSISERFDSEHRYVSMLCRTHGTLIAVSVGTAIASPFLLLKKRKLFAYTAVGAAALTTAGIKLLNVKWEKPIESNSR